MFRGSVRFEIDGDPIGSGGMGVVYRAFDREVGRHVALKSLRTTDRDLQYALKREFRLLIGLSHPNLVRLYDLFVDEKNCFFTMELVDGGPLSARTSSGELDLPRLKSALRQLVHGLSALHEAGTLHCDVKPSNVMTTSGGRVVLLDFGLSVLLGDPVRIERDTPAGTFAYMAPEQFWGQVRDPAVDWYGAGALLYEMLTATPPFRGPPARIADQKRRTAPRPRAIDSAVPTWLDDLVAALMDPDPAKRPGAAEILDRIGEKADVRRSLRDRASDHFVGRERELRQLAGVLESVRAGATAVVHASGSSGVGKTALLERFTEEAEHNGAIVLRGRCHFRESVPYKALDPIVDRLSHHLIESGSGELLSRDAGALFKIFPILARVPQLRSEGAEGAIDIEADPRFVRRSGFAALREILANLARRAPLVLWIDDLQWGDTDSLAALRAILAAPDPPRLMLLLSYREEDRASGEALRELAEAPLEPTPSARVTITVGPLSAEESEILTRIHLGTGGEDPRRLEIAREAQGSPLLIGTLARHAVRAGRAPMRLEEVLAEHLQHLSPEERLVLETVSVAAIPLTETLAASAARLEGTDVFATLCNHCLLKRSADAAGRVLVYHDRIREAVVAALSEETLQARHASLAKTLGEAPDADPQVLVTHHLGAGELEVAGEFAAQAALRAAESLAFGRAAKLFQLAVDLRPGDLRCRDWLVGLAEALANAGRSGESAAHFEKAAHMFAQASDVDKMHTLRRESANQYMRGGHFDQGMAAIRDVLAHVGVQLPATEKKASAQALRLRVKMLLRGKRFHLRDAAELAPEALLRLDAMWNATMNLSMLTPVYASAIGGLHLLEALRLGERSRLIQALGMECAFEAAVGGRIFGPRAEKTRATVEELARPSQHPYDLAWTLLTQGSSAWHRGSWRTGWERCSRAAELFETRCRGAAWEVGANKIFAYSSLAFLGDMKTLSVRVPADLAEADDRGDLFASNHYRLGQMSVFRLAEDRAEDAVALANAARAEWPTSMYSTHHYHYFTLMIQAHLYRNDPWAAWALVQEEWPRLEAAQFLLLGMVRAELSSLRARVALAAARAGGGSKTWTPRRLLADAKHCARTLARGRVVPAVPWASSVRAGIAAFLGRREDAKQALEEASIGFERAEMALYRGAAKLELARLGYGSIEEPRADMCERGVVVPERLARVLMPDCTPLNGALGSDRAEA